MLRIMWRWMDSWSVNSVELTDAQNDNKIQWFRILPFIILHLSCLAIFWVGISWFAVGFMLFFYLIRMFAITGFFHRYLSHKTFQTSRPVQFLFLLIGTMSAQRGPLWWAAHHRNHHRYADTTKDPHSSQHGFWYSHIGWFLNQKNFVIRQEMVKDWLKYPELIWLDRFSLPIVLMTAASIFCFGEALAHYAPQLHTNGLQLLIWGFCVSTIFVIHATLCINSLAHLFGRCDFATRDDSKNNLWLALITLGEGWHNKHHYYAGSARQGFYWWQVDLTYYGLKMMSYLGLVWGLKPVPERVYLVHKQQSSDPITDQPRGNSP